MDNLRSALSFVRDRDAEQYLTMVGALAYFWWARSHLIEGRTHLHAALSVSSPQPVRRSYARALRGQGMLSAYEGGHSSARQLMEQTLAMWRQLGDPMEIAASLETLGWSQFLASEDEAACATFEELLEIMRNHGDPNLINRAKVAMGQMLVALSRVDEARVFANEILEFSRRTGDRRAEHSGFHFLADCALIEGNAVESLGLYRESLILAAAIGDRMETTFEIEGIGMSLVALGRHADGIRLIAASRAECARLGINLQIRFWNALHDRFVTPAREALGPLQGEAAERAGREMTFEATVTEASTLASAG
jgi:tetratricopeptide (TPR) repeat protein